MVAKEHFVFTDPEGQLYHFSVEGNAIKDGTKIPAEANLCKEKNYLVDLLSLKKTPHISLKLVDVNLTILFCKAASFLQI